MEKEIKIYAKNEQSAIDILTKKYRIKEDRIFLTNLNQVENDLILYDALLDFDQLYEGKKYLQNIINFFTSEYKIEHNLNKNNIDFKIKTNINNLLIENNGEFLDALNYLLKRHVLKDEFDIKNVNVDISNYRENREIRLKKLALDIANEVQKTKIEVKLDPMNSYERQVIHKILCRFKNIKTKSEGSNDNRYIVIKYKENKS